MQGYRQVLHQCHVEAKRFACACILRARFSTEIRVWDNQSGCLLPADQLLTVQPFILGVVELMTVPELDKNFGKCVSQALVEHLAAYHLLGLWQQLHQDLLVLLADAHCSCLIAQSSRDAGAIHAHQIHEPPLAAAVVKHILAQRLSVLLGGLGKGRDSGDQPRGEEPAACDCCSWVMTWSMVAKCTHV